MTKQNFNQFFNNEALTQLLHQLAEDYPALVTLEKIGQSYEGREISVAAVTNQVRTEVRCE